MKTKVLLFLMAACLLAVVARLAQGPSPAQADDIPEKYRDTVHKGLEYLVKQQAKDGHWEGDGGKHPVAMTGLVGLTLLMERNNPGGREFGGQGGKAIYSAQIGKAADWLMDQSEPKRDGLLFSDHASETSRYMQGHGLATLFLAGVCRYEKDEMRHKKLTDVLTRAVKYIVKAQSTQGGWYHTSKVEGHDFADLTTTVIQIQALQAAENAGIPVPAGVIDSVKVYLKSAMNHYAEMAKSNQNRSATDAAAALACSQSWNLPKELFVKWHAYCDADVSKGRNIKSGRDELMHYYYAQAMHNVAPNTFWNAYRTATFDHLQSTQSEDGSWPAGNGLGVGPIYSTAVWCTILQLDKRSHPSMRRDLEITIITRRPIPLPKLAFAMRPVGDAEAQTRAKL